MTISYSGNFARLLVRWKGSVWKATWKELILWLFCYYLVRVIYRHGLKDSEKFIFEKIIVEFDDYTKRIPLTFILGFYVATVVKRWWEQFQHIAWPDSCLHSLCFFMHPTCPENEQETATRRRTIARYLNLTACLAYRDISTRVRKRFPNLEHLIRAEMMTEEELVVFQKSVDSARWFLPLEWAQDLVQEYCEKHTVAAPYVTQFLGRLYDYRQTFHKLFCYDWICIPLVYTQVSALATYGYFILCFIGRQFIENRYGDQSIDRNSTNLSSSLAGDRCYQDYYIPVFSIVEFLFYVGWFKVAQDIMRPFGEDDDDYELNYILDRNIKVSVAIVNGCDRSKPSFPPNHELGMWADAHAADVPYTKLSKPERNHPPKMHAYVEIKDSSVCAMFNDDREECVAAVLKRERTKRWRYF